jgi:5-methylcytosine-specific restriction protein A
VSSSQRPGRARGRVVRGTPGFVGRGAYISVVTLGDVTRTGVLAAVVEFDRLGRDAFLKSTGFGPARAYFLQHDGRLYDSKAIVGYAHGVSTGVPMRPKDFSGGDDTVAQRLGTLGFEVLNLERPDWTRDEIILACALAESNGWRQVYDHDERARELSQLLQSPAIHPLPRHPDFRNPAGVGQKTRNIADKHPDHRGKRSNGNYLDEVVLKEFLADPIGMRAMAKRIRELLTTDGAINTELPDLDTADIPEGEGSVALRAHLRRERNPKLRRRKLDHTKRRGLPIACEVCDFDFGHAYGSHGLDYIECHHRTPLHVTGKTQTRLSDLALLCSNCHRMIHRTKRWLTVEELKELVDKQRTRC